MGTELMAAEIVLRTVGFDTVEKDMQRVVQMFPQLEAYLGKYESASAKASKNVVAGMNQTETKAKTLGEAIATAGEQAAQRQAVAERKLSALQLEGVRAREAGRRREEQAAKAAEAAREREVAAEARRQKAIAAESQAAQLKRGMIVGQLAVGAQDSAAVLSGGGSWGQAMGAGANNFIQAVSLASPQWAAVAAAGVTVAQLAQLWYNVSGNTAEATRKAEEYRQVLAQAHASAVSGAALVPGKGRDFLKTLIGEQDKSAGLKVQLDALKAEEDRLRARLDNPELKRRAGASRVFGAVTADAEKAIEESRELAAQINAVGEERKKLYAEWKTANDKVASMTPRTEAARFDQAKGFRRDAAMEVAGLQGQEVVDRYREVGAEREVIDAQRAKAKERIGTAATDAEKKSLEQMISLLDSEAVRLGTLYFELGNKLHEAKEKIAEDKVFKKGNEVAEFLKDTDTDSATNQGVKLIQDAQTVADAESKIAFFRSELQREAKDPEFTGRRQGQLQSLISAAVRRRDELLDRQRPVGDTDEVLRQTDNARAGRNLSNSLAMVDDKSALQKLWDDTDIKLKNDSSLTRERRDELMSEREALQDRMEAIDRQKEQEGLQDKMEKFRRGNAVQKFGFSGLHDQILQSAGRQDETKLMRDHLEELRKQTAHLEKVVDEIRKPRGATAF